MKNVLTLLLAITLSLGLLPVSAFAIEANDKEFKAFLQEIGWTSKDYETYLKSKDWTLRDFDFVDELGTPLSEEGVQAVLKEFDLSREKLNELLTEYGALEEGQDVLEGTYVIFEEDLFEEIDFIIGTPINDENLQQLLNDYNLKSIDELDALLAENDDSRDNYEYIEDLESSVDYYINGDDWEGTPINDENLQQLLNDYNLKSIEELKALLKENDDSLENYEYIEDLEWTVDFYINGDDYMDEEIADLFTQIDLTDEEMEKLFAHLETLNWEDPAFLDQMMLLADRMMAFEDFETADELSAEQVAELLSIFSEMKQLLQIETKYYLVVDGQKQPISMDTLMTMDSTNGNDLIMEILNLNGELLADIRITADMFGSEIIQETGKDIQKVEEVVSAPPTKAKPPVKTVKGGELPKTATNHLGNVVLGLGIAAAGILLFRRMRVKGF
ncbi:processed acidic surface protein [Fictibacillus sp. b24]|uniref:processed acidic surface protein n=1 Tax=Fictibacillus sp. b24 TaxID=3055863 RepID=UPI0025A0B9DB|nr:processed acidic surface protein [Fictibacillus sp. b24]MDM5316233.1 processed acidic surface protein [Fictibacillus sp. b24]